jgi:hypothetical protein
MTMDINSFTITVSVLQKGSPTTAEVDAAAEARSRHPGTVVTGIRWLAASPFDRSLGGRWVDLEVDVAPSRRRASRANPGQLR